MQSKLFLVADFAGRREEALAFCEAHPEFQVVILPEPGPEGLPTIGIECDSNDGVEQAYLAFERLGWDRGSVEPVEMTDDEVD